MGIQGIGISALLHNMGDCIKPEAVDPFFQPPLHHFMQLVDHGGILPVQVRLEFGIEMQIIFIRLGIKLPD
ncbi:hypothetical protein D3C75_1330320 [compost metagenome]